MNSRNAILALLLPLLAAAAFACKSSKKAHTGATLAEVGHDVISADDFKKRLDETSPFLRARYNTPERKKEFLENLIKNELLAQEAERRGLEKSPAVQEVTRRAMVQELLKQQLDERLSGSDLSDADLKAYYDGHVSDYQKPELARINHLLVAYNNDRGAARAKATRLLREIADREGKGELNAFQVVAMKESEDAASKTVGGDLRYLSKAEMAKEVGQSVADAAFSLAKPGDKAGPIEAERGFELIRLQNKTIALDKKLGEVKEMVRQRMARERRSKDYDDFINKLRKDGNVKIHEEEIAKLPNAEPTPGPQFPGLQQTSIPPPPPKGGPLDVKQAATPR